MKIVVVFKGPNHGGWGCSYDHWSRCVIHQFKHDQCLPFACVLRNLPQIHIAHVMYARPRTVHNSFFFSHLCRHWPSPVSLLLLLFPRWQQPSMSDWGRERETRHQRKFWPSDVDKWRQTMQPERRGVGNLGEFLSIWASEVTLLNPTHFPVSGILPSNRVSQLCVLSFPFLFLFPFANINLHQSPSLGAMTWEDLLRLLLLLLLSFVRSFTLLHTHTQTTTTPTAASSVPAAAAAPTPPTPPPPTPCWRDQRSRTPLPSLCVLFFPRRSCSFYLGLRESLLAGSTFVVVVVVGRSHVKLINGFGREKLSLPARERERALGRCVRGEGSPNDGEGGMCVCGIGGGGGYRKPNKKRGTDDDIKCIV